MIHHQLSNIENKLNEIYFYILDDEQELKEAEWSKGFSTEKARDIIIQTLEDIQELKDSVILHDYHADVKDRLERVLTNLENVQFTFGAK